MNLEGPDLVDGRGEAEGPVVEHRGRPVAPVPAQHHARRRELVRVAARLGREHLFDWSTGA